MVVVRNAHVQKNGHYFQTAIFMQRKNTPRIFFFLKLLQYFNEINIFFWIFDEYNLKAMFQNQKYVKIYLVTMNLHQKISLPPYARTHIIQQIVNLSCLNDINTIKKKRLH